MAVGMMSGCPEMWHSCDVGVWCRTTRVAAKRASPGSSAATRSRVDDPTASIAFSNGQNHVLSASDFR